MRGNAEQVSVYERAAGENVNVPLHCVCVHFVPLRVKINFLPIERKSRTGEYLPEVVAVRSEESEVRIKTTEGNIP